MRCFRFIEAEKANHPVRRMCRVLGVSHSGFYAWQSRPASPRALEDEVLTVRIVKIHNRSHGTYGSPRVHVALSREGIRVGRKRVARLMRTAELQGCRTAKRYRTTTRSEDGRPAPDLVEREFTPEGPNRLWTADITYLRTWEGTCYLAAILDAFSRKVVGWALATHLRTELVLEALEMAVRSRRPEAGLVHHSDQGCQYTSITFGHRLAEEGILPSMGSVGDAYDNAVTESFFATLKTELYYRRSWPTRRDLELALFSYIEGFYNRERLHSTLGYRSPDEFEAMHAEVASVR